MKHLFIFLIPILFSCTKEKETVLPELKYGQHERHVTDFQYISPTCYLFVHGGAWISGDKSDWNDAHKIVTRKGYSYAAMNYRFLPDTNYLGMQEDIHLCITKLKQLGIKKVYLVASSAGTNIAMLYASNHDIEGVVCFAPIITTETKLEHHLLTVAQKYGAVTLFDSTIKNLTLIHYNQDYLVHYSQSLQMKKEGVNLWTLNGADHVPPQSKINEILDALIK